MIEPEKILILLVQERNCFMHYTGTIWRPPYEAGSLLIEVTAGCAHHKCKFCTLYADLPFQFCMSPLTDIEADLQEAQYQLHERGSSRVKRVYLVGANPFVLQFKRLKEISELVHQYFMECETIGCFARVTDVALKTDEELQELHGLGYDGITIGAETGDEAALDFMDKGYKAQDIVIQAERLNNAHITYNFFYLTGVSDSARGVDGALESAKIFNMTRPKIMGSSMLTIYPESELYGEIQKGRWQEKSELEKLEEVKALIEHLITPLSAIRIMSNLQEISVQREMK